MVASEACDGWLMGSGLGAVSRSGIFPRTVPTRGEQLCREYTTFHLIVDERERLLNPSRDKIMRRAPHEEDGVLEKKMGGGDSRAGLPPALPRLMSSHAPKGIEL